MQARDRKSIDDNDLQEAEATGFDRGRHTLRAQTATNRVAFDVASQARQVFRYPSDFQWTPDWRTHTLVDFAEYPNPKRARANLVQPVSSLMLFEVAIFS